MCGLLGDANGEDRGSDRDHPSLYPVCGTLEPPRSRDPAMNPPDPATDKPSSPAPVGASVITVAPNGAVSGPPPARPSGPPPASPAESAVRENAEPAPEAGKEEVQPARLAP